jgi:hypothetical protein
MLSIVSKIFAVIVYSLMGAILSPFIRDAWPYSIFITIFLAFLVIVSFKKVPKKWRTALLAIIFLIWLGYGLCISVNYIPG